MRGMSPRNLPNCEFVQEQLVVAIKRKVMHDEVDVEIDIAGIQQSAAW